MEATSVHLNHNRSKQMLLEVDVKRWKLYNTLLLNAMFKKERRRRRTESNIQMHHFTFTLMWPSQRDHEAKNAVTRPWAISCATSQLSFIDIKAWCAAMKTPVNIYYRNPPLTTTCLTPPWAGRSASQTACQRVIMHTYALAPRPTGIVGSRSAAVKECVEG